MSKIKQFGKRKQSAFIKADGDKKNPIKYKDTFSHHSLAKEMLITRTSVTDSPLKRCHELGLAEWTELSATK